MGCGNSINIDTTKYCEVGVEEIVEKTRFTVTCKIETSNDKSAKDIEENCFFKDMCLLEAFDHVCLLDHVPHNSDEGSGGIPGKMTHANIKIYYYQEDKEDPNEQLEHIRTINLSGKVCWPENCLAIGDELIAISDHWSHDIKLIGLITGEVMNEIAMPGKRIPIRMVSSPTGTKIAVYAGIDEMKNGTMPEKEKLKSDEVLIYNGDFTKKLAEWSSPYFQDHREGKIQFTRTRDEELFIRCKEKGFSDAQIHMWKGNVQRNKLKMLTKPQPKKPPELEYCQDEETIARNAKATSDLMKEHGSCYGIINLQLGEMNQWIGTRKENFYLALPTNTNYIDFISVKKLTEKSLEFDLGNYLVTNDERNLIGIVFRPIISGNDSTNLILFDIKYRVLPNDEEIKVSTRD